ncbi:MAG: HDOD domain-containing protein [Gammaproteobacteria bacterium]|nr:HDOD domain-containing protein [Gammaproteobacteria bacterium]
MTDKANKSPPNQAGAENSALVGRQSIYDRNLDILGYELLYRPSEGGSLTEVNGNVTTGEVMLNAFLELGLESLVDDKLAFINLTQDYVEGLIAIPFPSGSIVLEVLEDIDPTPVVIQGIERLKSRGFTIALDDFVFDEHLMPLVPLADIIKVDIMGVSDDELEAGLDSLHDIFQGKLLAEKIETQVELDMCKDFGFDYFQGSFLEKPVVVKGQKMPSNKVATIQLLSRLQDESVEFDELEDIVKNDPSLSFKLLRYINSPAFSLGSKVSSIKQALVLLGLATLKHWMTIIVVSGESGKSPDLILKALSRAHMCERLAKMLKLKNQDQYFLVGLFSILDAMMDQEKAVILDQLPIHEELKLALLEEKGNMGRVIKCVLAYEHADWEEVRCGKAPLKAIQRVYMESIKWANEQVSILN